jgi:GAF domain-containing protein
MTTTQDETIADLQRTIAELRRERDSALSQRQNDYGERAAHQAATIDVLKLMAASPGDPQPVFDMIVTRARDLCDAYGVTVTEFDGTLIHHRASTGISDDPAVRAARLASYPKLPERDDVQGRAILDRHLIRVDDLEAEPGLNPAARGLTAKSVVVLPMMRGGAAIGTIGMGSRERGGFSDTQIELLKTFVEQAVIAITSAETYRALRSRTAELQESLKYQAATIDVLKVMSSSTSDTQPVFDIILREAMRLCDCQFGGFHEFDGEFVHLRAARGVEPDKLADYIRPFPMRPTRQSIAQRAILDKQVIYLRDGDAEPDRRSATRNLGWKSQLVVPLLREGTAIGAISLGSPHPNGFTEANIELVKTFAEQAVIAIGSTATFRALQTRTADLTERDAENRALIARQQASIEILNQISASPDDARPVLDLIVRHACDLSGAAAASLIEFDGTLMHQRGMAGWGPEAEARLRAMFPMPPNMDAVPGRVVLTGQTVHIRDIQSDPSIFQAGRGLGHRSSLGVPLLRDGRVIGVLFLARFDIGGFDEAAVGLLQSFAEQAVIALNSAAALKALRERTADLTARDAENTALIARQAASIEVLKAISASPDDAQPVLDLIVRRAKALANAQTSTLTEFDGTLMHLRTWDGHRPEAMAVALATYPRPPGPETLVGRVVLSGQILHVADVQGDPAVHQPGRALGYRAFLGVPLMREGRVVGVLGLGRIDPGEFDHSAIELVQSFAEQAVIALSSAAALKALRERTSDLQESLEYQTATADVLKVISRSTFDLQPVLDTVVQTAARLCEAEMALIGARDGDKHRMIVNHGFPPEYEAYQRRRGWDRLDPASPTAGQRAILEGRVVHIHDAAVVPGYPDALVNLSGQRTVMAVPLLRDGEATGTFVLARRRVEPFTERQIELVRTFADQAVIAIENTRLITEQQEALERQTAMAEVLEVINASGGDLTPVFDAVLEKAMRLCGAAFGSLYTYDGDRFHSAAQHGVPPAYAAFRAKNPPILQPGSAIARFLESKKPDHVLDLKAGELYQTANPNVRAMVDLGGIRTLVSVPLLKDDALLGYISIYRQEVRAFSDKEIALLENFAAQAVIAMENARLLDEQREALEQQTATAEILGVINASPGDLAPVFETILAKAHTLCGAEIGSLGVFDGHNFRKLARHGYPKEVDAWLSEPYPALPQHAPLFRCQTIHASDILTHPWGDAADLSPFKLYADLGLRAWLEVPLWKDGTLVGTLSGWRHEPRAFAEKEIRLLQSFAAQAVIAMENARLLNELRARTDELAQRRVGA